VLRIDNNLGAMPDGTQRFPIIGQGK